MPRKIPLTRKTKGPSHSPADGSTPSISFGHQKQQFGALSPTKSVLDQSQSGESCGVGVPTKYHDGAAAPTGEEWTMVGEPPHSGSWNTVSQVVYGLHHHHQQRAAEHLRPPVILDCQSEQAAGQDYYLCPFSPPLLLVRSELEGNGRDLWEDQAFPPDDTSLFGPGGQNPGIRVEWKRPHEIEANPKFFIEFPGTNEASYHPLSSNKAFLQGNEWYLAAMAALTTRQALFCTVTGPDQQVCRGSNSDSGYFGAFTFNFYHAGSWRNVTVDDRLPTVGNRPMFVGSGKCTDEFWPCLLEKALAKAMGGYYKIMDKRTTWLDVAACLGLFPETFNIKSHLLDGLNPESVRKRIIEAGQDKSVACATVVKFSQVGEQGNCMKYSKYGLQNCSLDTYIIVGLDPERGVKLRPIIHMEDRGHEAQEIGWETFISNFHHVSIGHVGHDSVGRDAAGWVAADLIGSWAGSGAGGCPHFLSTFVNNPQYQIFVESNGQELDGGTVEVLLSLEQLSSIRHITSKINYSMTMEKFPVGFLLFPLAHPGHRLSPGDIMRISWVADSGPYRYEKRVAGRYRLPPGGYTLVPTTYYPECMGEFVVRIMVRNMDNERVNLKNLNTFGGVVS